MTAHTIDPIAGIAPSPETVRQMRADGLLPYIGWHKPDRKSENGAGDRSSQEGQSGVESDESPGTDTKRPPKDAAARQREQTKRDRAKSRVKCSVKTADDDESKALLHQIGERLYEDHVDGSRTIHQAIKLILEDPELAALGKRVRLLSGLRRWFVLALIA